MFRSFRKYTNRTMSSVTEQISKLRDLKDGWDNGKGIAPMSSLIDLVEKLLSHVLALGEGNEPILALSKGNEPMLDSTLGGGIDITWKRNLYCTLKPDLSVVLHSRIGDQLNYIVPDEFSLNIKDTKEFDRIFERACIRIAAETFDEYEPTD